MNYYIANLSKNPTDSWWRHTVQLGVLTAGFKGEPGDEGEDAMGLPQSGDWVIVYANGHGYVGAGITGDKSEYRLVDPDELPVGFEKNHRHWRPISWKYVILSLNDAITIKEAGRHPPPKTIQAIRDSKVARHMLELLKKRGTSPIADHPEEISRGTEYWEGAVVQVLANKYERDRAARDACIAHHGLSCHACGMSFEGSYGPIGTGFIHVHHTVPIATIQEKYKVDPIADLVPLCANCHAMAHRENPPLTIMQLKEHLR